MTTGLLACIDVAYEADRGVAACVLATDWASAAPVATHVVRVDRVAPYVPGRFFERELPCIRAVLEAVQVPLEVLIVDGYVWLDDRGTKGLGAHLFDALDGRLPVVGVAKTSFRGAAFAEQVLRGSSARPLYVTAVGMDAAEAARHIRAMHGAHRVPTLLRAVDRACRAPQEP